MIGEPVFHLTTSSRILASFRMRAQSRSKGTMNSIDFYPLQFHDKSDLTKSNLASSDEAAMVIQAKNLETIFIHLRDQ